MASRFLLSRPRVPALRASISSSSAAARLVLPRSKTLVKPNNIYRSVRPLSLSSSALSLSAASSQSTSSSWDEMNLCYPKTHITRLRNGMTVASECIPSMETATVGVWIDAGSRAETAANNGVAHFLEHLLFKGTKSRTQVALEKEIENMGAMLNAYTSREQTVYLTKLFSADMSRGVSILSDIISNCLLDSAAIENERSVILRELEEIENNMEETIFDHLHATAFPDSTLGYTIIGPRENVASISRNDLASFISNNYTPNRMALVAVGNVQHDSLCELAEKAFVNLPASKSDSFLATGGSAVWRKEDVDFVGSDVRLRFDDMQTAYMAIAVAGCGWESPDYWPLQVASCMIGSFDRLSGAPSTQLARVVAEDNLANGYMSFNTTYTGTGLWGVYATSNERCKLEDLTCSILKTWAHLKTDPSEYDFQRARETLKSRVLLRLDGSTPLAEEIGTQLLVWGRRITPYEICKAIDAVTLDDIQRVANHYIYDKDPAAVSIGPVEGFPDWSKIRSSMSLVRF